ncbi:MAG: cpsA, partial [Frankiales bacterium]|nr:cpsA [Frankiales bacterium]
INHLLGHKSAYEAAQPVAPATVSLTVLNGGQAGGSAQTNANALIAAGFKATFGDGASSAKTTINYPAGMESQAKTLAGYVPGAVVAQSSQVNVLTLVLGADGKSAKGVAATSSSASAPVTTPAPSSSDHAHATSAPVVRTAAQTGCIN